MRSLILTLIVIASCIGVNAQTTLRVNNHTSCPVYFSTLLSTAANSCSAPHTGSTVIMLPPGGSVLYTNTTYPGYFDPTYVNFYNMRIYNGPGHCGTPVHLGLVCSPFPQSTPTTYSLPNCSPCGTGTATWTLTGSLVTVDFY